MSRATRIGIAAVVGAFASAPLPAQSTTLGMRSAGTYVQPPWKLSGTLICRGGPTLRFEGPLTMPRRRADLVPPGQTVTIADLQTFVDVSVRRLTFQTAPGAAGPDGLGLKLDSQCAYRDRAFSGYVSPAIVYEAASETFEIASSGNVPFSRRGTVQDYLQDVDHFWAFDVIERGFYFEVKAHRRLDVTLLTQASSMGSGTITATQAKAAQAATTRPSQATQQTGQQAGQTPQVAQATQTTQRPSQVRPAQPPIGQLPVQQAVQQPVKQPLPAPPTTSPSTVKPSAPILGRTTRDPAAGHAIARLLDVRVTPELNGVGIRFIARPDASPLVEIGRDPVVGAPGGLSMRNPVLRFSPTRDNRSSSSSVTYYIGQSMVATGVRLEPGTTYYYLITVPALPDRPAEQQSGSFVTASRNVTVTFTQIYILSDSDDEGAGEFDFNFHAQNEGAAAWVSGDKFSFDAESGSRQRLGHQLVIANAADRITIAVSGYEDDATFRSFAPMEPAPAPGPSRSSLREVNVARGTLDLTGQNRGFTLRSVGPGPHGSRLFFDVAGYVEVHLVPGRVLRGA